MNLRIAISGAGFLADAYDLFVINVAVDLMSRCDYHQALTPDMKTTIKSMALAGAVVGQLGFGAIADLIGRRKVFIITCALVLLGARMSAVVTDTSAGIYSQLCFWRFILGVGVGGEYPLSASITSESSEDGNRAKNLATVFSMQGIGTVLCSMVLVILTNSDISYDAQWRIALGLGGLPMALAFYFRWKMHETTWREESQAFQNKEQLRAISETNNNIVEESSLNKVMSYFSNGFSYIRRIVWKNRISLLGTAGAWFILDIVFYANGLFSGQVTKAMGIASSPRQESFAALILQLLALPGYFCTIFYVSSIGLFRLQLIGFAMTAIIFFLLAGLQPYLVKIPVLYVFLYGFTFFFQNFGANATTYIIPSIIFSSAERATCHGISSAAGKLGALLGAQVFLFVVDAFCHNGNCDKSSTTKQVNSGLQLTFFVCGVLAVIGWIWSYFLVSDIPAVSLLENQTRTNLKDDEDEESSVHLYEMVDLQASSHGLLPPVSEESGLGSRNSTKAQGNRFLPNFSFFSLSSAVTTSEELNRQDKDYYLVKVIDDEEVTVNDRESLSTKEIGSRLTDVSASLLKEPQIDEGEVNNPLFPNRSTTSSNADILLLPEGKKKEKGSKDKGKKETKEKDKDKKKKKQKNKDRQDYDDDIAL